MPILKSCAKCGKPIIEGMYCKECAGEAAIEEKPKRISIGDIIFTVLVLGFIFFFWRKYQEFKSLPPGTLTQVKDGLLLLPGVLIARCYEAFFGKSMLVDAQMAYLILAVLFYFAAFVVLLLAKKKFDW